MSLPLRIVLLLSFLAAVPANAAPAARDAATLDETLRAPSRLQMPTVPIGEAAFAGEFQGPHRVALLDNGLAAYEARLRLVELAEREIDLETFVFEPDLSGQALLQAIVRKKARMDAAGIPFRARILLDRFSLYPGDPGLSDAQLSELRRRGVEVKLFHQGVLPWSYSYRNHQKLFAIDGREFIVGGRNIESRYFGIASPSEFPNGEYYDTDIYVRGPAAAGAQAAFDAYWNAGLSDDAAIGPPDAAAAAFLDDARLVDPRLAAVRAKGKLKLAQVAMHDADPVTYLADKPGDRPENRRTEAAVMQLEESAGATLVMENWTMIPMGREKQLFTDLLGRGVETHLLTNSVRAHDDTESIVLLAAPQLEEYARQGMRVYELTGHPTGDVGLDRTENDTKMWSTHSKVACVDAASCYVGSANNDPRSKDINAENGVIVNRNPQFAREILRELRGKIRDAYLLSPDGRLSRVPDAATGGGSIGDEGPTPPEVERTKTIGIRLLNLTKFLQ